MTAIGNDYDFSKVFSRQLEGICTKGDFVVGISTSGNSPNVIEGIRTASKIGAFTLALTGRDGGKVRNDQRRRREYCFEEVQNLHLLENITTYF